MSLDPSDFSKISQAESQKSFLAELAGFFRQNKKWWMLPVFIIILLLGVLLILAGTGAAPFIYTLF